MEYIQKIFKREGWMSILISAIFAILGIILIWKAQEIITLIAWILGTIFIVIGASKIISSITAKGKFDLYNYEIIFGIIMAIIGIVTIIYNQEIIKILNIIIGIWIIYTALLRIGTAIKIKKENPNAWIYAITLAIIMLICGIYVILNVGAVIEAIGIVLLIYSIIDIIEEILIIKTIGE